MFRRSGQVLNDWPEVLALLGVIATQSAHNGVADNRGTDGPGRPDKALQLSIDLDVEELERRLPLTGTDLHAILQNNLAVGLHR